MAVAGHRRVSPPDPELLAAVRDRDAEAFDALVVQYRDAVMRYVLRGLRDYNIAEDITQDVFLKVYRHAPRLEGPQVFVPWLFRVARTTLIDHQRRLARERRVLSERFTPGDAETATAPDQQEAAEAEEALRNALAGLPERFRTALVLRETEGLSYAEIARTLRLPEKTVSSRISRARRLLAQRLEALQRT